MGLNSWLIKIKYGSHKIQLSRHTNLSIHKSIHPHSIHIPIHPSIHPLIHSLIEIHPKKNSRGEYDFQPTLPNNSNLHGNGNGISMVTRWHHSAWKHSKIITLCLNVPLWEPGMGLLYTWKTRWWVSLKWQRMVLITQFWNVWKEHLSWECSTSIRLSTSLDFRISLPGWHSIF